MTQQAPPPPPGTEPEVIQPEPKADLRSPASWLPTVKVTAGAFLIAGLIFAATGPIAAGELT